jgi:hypothetical protein
MGIGLLSPRLTALSVRTKVPTELFGISQAFAWLSPARRRIIQLLLTRAPLYSYCYFLVRLACLRHAASVHSEPESNSLFQRKFCYVITASLNFWVHTTCLRKFISPALTSLILTSFAIRQLSIKQSLEFSLFLNCVLCLKPL